MARLLLCGAIVVALTLGSTAAARADDACWALLYAAIERDAAAPHAAYITYNELVDIREDGFRYERTTANITYRDDGQASIDDDRWSHPFVSNLLDPGPPVLGPYGDRRADWLTAAANAYALPLIADVHNQPERQCLDRGDEYVNGVNAAHLVIPNAPTDRQALKEIWIDRHSHAIARVVIAEYLKVYTSVWNLRKALTDFSIDMESVDGHDVVQRVTWQYTFHVYDQTSLLAAEYDFSNYRFEQAPPAGSLFASEGK
ncbi:MAG TPA: hypothetical protein VMB20_14015 [Candidatus Acidoferrum sp.]|nr:hypothetical protein [Candidatus Acidoferrum sp.]